MGIWNEIRAGVMAEREAMARQLEKLQERRQRLVDLLVKGTLDEATYKEQVEKIDAEIIVKRIELTEAVDIEAGAELR